MVRKYQKFQNVLENQTYMSTYDNKCETTRAQNTIEQKYHNQAKMP